jgi:ankyrin repeat protein
VMELLLDRGAGVDEADTTHTNPLIAAAEEGRLEALQWLLKRGASLNVVGPEALTRATARGRVDVVKHLLSLGLHATDGDLLYAIEGGSQPVLEVIIQELPGVCKRNPEALYTAVSGENVEMVRLLIENGANPAVPLADHANHSALDRAKEMRREDLVEILNCSRKCSEQQQN